MDKTHTVYTVGYGGRPPSDFVRRLEQHGVRMIADVRLQPQRASMGSYCKAKTPEKGIQRLFAEAGIAYAWFEELGNEFRELDDWLPRYREQFAREGEERCRRLLATDLAQPICLLCAEREPTRCHRSVIAELLEGRGFAIEHIV